MNSSELYNGVSNVSQMGFGFRFRPIGVSSVSSVSSVSGVSGKQDTLTKCEARLPPIWCFTCRGPSEMAYCG
ncbi:MAG: hypothetical protein ACI30R_06640, partial [Sodaliphilus sp.]